MRSGSGQVGAAIRAADPDMLSAVAGGYIAARAIADSLMKDER